MWQIQHSGRLRFFSGSGHRWAEFGRGFCLSMVAAAAGSVNAIARVQVSQSANQFLENKSAQTLWCRDLNAADKSAFHLQIPGENDDVGEFAWFEAAAIRIQAY
jgi:hypothetical protein